MAIQHIHLAQLEYAKTQPWFPTFVQAILNSTNPSFQTISTELSIVDSFGWETPGVAHIDWAAIDSELMSINAVTSREDLKKLLRPYRESNPEWFI